MLGWAEVKLGGKGPKKWPHAPTKKSLEFRVMIPFEFADSTTEDGRDVTSHSNHVVFEPCDRESTQRCHHHVLAIKELVLWQQQQQALP